MLRLNGAGNENPACCLALFAATAAPPATAASPAAAAEIFTLDESSPSELFSTGAVSLFSTLFFLFLSFATASGVPGRFQPKRQTGGEYSGTVNPADFDPSSKGLEVN